MDKVSSLTVDELKQLIKETVEELFIKYSTTLSPSSYPSTHTYYETNPNPDWLHKVWCMQEDEIHG